EEFVVKDYWVTRALRAVASAETLKGYAVFKGGTSLSKGFDLLERFSEDLDLLLTGEGFGPVPDDPDERKRILRTVHDVIASGTGLTCPKNQFDGKDGEFWLVRRQYHAVYRYMLPGKAGTLSAPASDWIKVEPGYRGGPHPHITRSLNSMCATFLSQHENEK